MISKQTLGQIITDYYQKDLPKGIERELTIDLRLPIQRAITIMGPRRCGKTYYLYSLIRQLRSQGIRKNRTLYVNFENPQWTQADLEDLMQLMEVYFEMYPQCKEEEIWLFFDEIQNIENWERFIRGLLDTQKAHIFLSGSSSKLLSKEIATALRGRNLSYLLLPFSFSEFLKTQGIIYKKYLSSQERSKIQYAMKEYFSYGGYPEAILYSKERERIINEIIEVTIYRDLIERHNIRNHKLVKLMFNYLIQAKEFSVHKFYQFLRSLPMRVSKNSLYNYLGFFNDAFLFFPLRKFSFSLKYREQSIAKIFTVDNVFITTILGEDHGKKLENVVFLSLLRQGYELNKHLFYYVTSSGLNEVDFLVKDEKETLHLIHVCFDPSHYLTKEREVKSLVQSAKEVHCKNLIVVTFDAEFEEKYEGFNVRFIPLWRWLLDDGSALNRTPLTVNPS